jgi:hypothetical protein
MIKTDKLIGLMAEKHITQKDMAERLHMAPKTFYLKMKKGVFGSDEIEVMINELDIQEPTPIFFARE